MPGWQGRVCVFARMAELVDALVSNTSGSNAVPVRSRLRVQKKSESVSECESTNEHSHLFFLNTHTHTHTHTHTSFIYSGTSGITNKKILEKIIAYIYFISFSLLYKILYLGSRCFSKHLLRRKTN
jgi:hypothetical protein